MSEDFNPPHTLAELLGVNVEVKRSGDDAVDMKPDEMVEALSTFFDRYGKNPFKVGDIVTARKDSALRWAGRPAVVVESYEEGKDPPQFTGTSDLTYHSFGRRINLRIAMVVQEDGRKCNVCFWNEAHNYELYDPKVHSE